MRNNKGTVLLPVLASVVMIGLIILANLRIISGQQQLAMDTQYMLEESLVISNLKTMVSKVMEARLRSPLNSITNTNISIGGNILRGPQMAAVGGSNWEVQSTIPSAFSYIPFEAINTVNTIPNGSINFKDPLSFVFRDMTHYPTPINFDVSLRNLSLSTPITRTIPFRMTIAEVHTGNIGFVSMGNFDTVSSNVRVSVQDGRDILIVGDLDVTWSASVNNNYPVLSTTEAASNVVVTGPNWTNTIDAPNPSFSFVGARFFPTRYSNMWANLGMTLPQDFMNTGGSQIVQRQSYMRRLNNSLPNTGNTPIIPDVTVPTRDGIPNVSVIDLNDSMLFPDGTITRSTEVYAATDHVFIDAPTTGTGIITLVVRGARVTLRCRPNQSRPVVIVTGNNNMRLLSSNWVSEGEPGYDPALQASYNTPPPDVPGNPAADALAKAQRTWRGRLVLLGRNPDPLMVANPSAGMTNFNFGTAFNNRVQTWGTTPFRLLGSMFVGGGVLRVPNGSSLNINILEPSNGINPPDNYNNISERFFYVSSPFIPN